MSTRVSRYLTLGFVFSIALVLFFAPLSHAAEVSFDATIMSANFPSTVYYCATYAPSGYYLSGQCNQKYWISNAANQIRYDSGNTSVAGMKFFTPTGYSGVYNDIVQFEFDIMQGSGQANNAIDISLITLRSNTSNFDVIDVSPERTSNNTTHVKVLLWAKGNFSSNTAIILIPANVETANSNYYDSNFAWFRETGDLISGGLVNVFHIRSSGGSQFDDTQVLNSIQSVVDAVEESSNSQQEIYEDEKDTITDSRDEAQSSASSMDTSGFSFSNPFTTFFALFTDNVCVSIPTIQGWLHGTESQVCSPWRNTNVRSVLTPVFAILSTLIITGFVIRWLSSGNKEGTIEGI